MNNDFNFGNRFQIDDTEMDREYEMRVLELEQQAIDREEYFGKKKEVLNVNSEAILYDRQEVVNKSEYNKKLYLFDKYINVYNAEIINNEVLGRCSMHYVLGGLLKFKKIHKTEHTWLDYRIHLMLFQTSGSGKGMTANFVERLLNDIKFPKFTDKKELLPQEVWDTPIIMKSGKITPEALINNFQVNSKTGMIEKDEEGNDKINPGSLQTKDFLVYEEGGNLFNNSQSSSDKTDYFLQAMEPIGSSNNVIEKELASFEKSIKTTSSTSIFIMTRPIGKIKNTVAQSGFFQRCIFIPREIDYEVLHDMRLKSGFNDLEYMSGKRDSKSSKYYNDLIEEFKIIVNFAYNNDIGINTNNLDSIKLLYKNKMDWFLYDMINTIDNKVIREIISTLENRYKDNVFKLAYHSAVIRQSTTVDLEDFEYAFDLIMDLYVEQKNWLFEKIEVPTKDRKENIDFNQALFRAIRKDNNNIKTMEQIATEVAYSTDSEQLTVIKRINTMVKKKNSPVILRKNKLSLCI